MMVDLYVFSWDGDCNRAIQLLREHGFRFHVIQLDTLNSKQIRKILGVRKLPLMLVRNDGVVDIYEGLDEIDSFINKFSNVSKLKLKVF